MSSKLVFVTGASGFLGSHVVNCLLKAGYRVRATARGEKVDLLKHGYINYGSQFEVIGISDIATEDLTEALKGVDVVVHVAAPLLGTAEALLKSAIEGSLNIIRQGYQAGIKKFVVTSSIITCLGSEKLTDQSWTPVVKENALKQTGIAAYTSAKTLAERAAWEFADAHPDVDITTINPPYLYGPLVPEIAIPKPNYGILSTSLYIYRLLRPDGVFPLFPGYADVRDVAHIHVAAIDSPPESSTGRKRLLVASPWDLDYLEAVKLLSEQRPALISRLIKKEKGPEYPRKKLEVPLDRVEQVVGFKQDAYLPWQTTILDTVDYLVALEKKWVEDGYSIEIPLMDKIL